MQFDFFALESKVEPTSKSATPVLPKPRTKVKIERNETNIHSLKSQVKESSIKVDAVPVIKKEVENENILPVLETPTRVTKSMPEVELGQDDADDELEEGELREDEDDI